MEAIASISPWITNHPKWAWSGSREPFSNFGASYLWNGWSWALHIWCADWYGEYAVLSNDTNTNDLEWPWISLCLFETFSEFHISKNL